jgi:penicillin-binding protein 4B
MDHLRRRMFQLLLTFTGAFAIVAGLLFWIQIGSGGVYSSRQVDLVRRSVLQRGEELVLDSGRGQFTDRDGVPLTGESVPALVVFPLQTTDSESLAKLQRISEIIGDGGHDLAEWGRRLKQPEVWPNRTAPYRLSESQIKDIQELNYPGAQVMPFTVRYKDAPIARHLLGFIGEHPSRVAQHYEKALGQGFVGDDTPIGLAGLEKQFDRFLLPVSSRKVTVFTDGRKQPLEGLGTRLSIDTNPYYPLQIETTLSYSIQKAVEETAAKHKLLDGAIVVLDAKDANIVAMTSSPQFNPLQVNPSSSNWNNRAVQAIAPGSIFKTVVAAAALETGVVKPDDIFECHGSLGKYGFTCWLEHGHGRITFREAFAESCNIAFAQVIQKLGPEALEQTAARLGISARNGWSNAEPGGIIQLDGEEAGRIFADHVERYDEGVLVQTSIGQRDVRMNPLQAANLIVTLLNDGKSVQPRVVERIRYKTGGLMQYFPEQELSPELKPISKKTAHTLLEWMRDVVEYGTGTALQQSDWKVAGKSGTAETDQGTVHQWFIGYGPAEKPKYAVAVVVRNVPENERNYSLALFRDIMNILAEEESDKSL